MLTFVSKSVDVRFEGMRLQIQEFVSESGDLFSEDVVYSRIVAAIATAGDAAAQAEFAKLRKAIAAMNAPEKPSAQ